jgi:lincosamide nucleotidyltransferase A/C/D/E
MEIQANGDGIQRGFGQEVFVHAAHDRTVGVIGGRDVVVACAARLRQLRTGYEPRQVDMHDLKVLDSL